jgi:hypothetical protein
MSNCAFLQGGLPTVFEAAHGAKAGTHSDAGPALRVRDSLSGARPVADARSRSHSRCLSAI